MKRTLIAALALLYAQLLMAQTKQKLTIDEATVFLTGAELVNSATLKLAKGENEILFTNVASNVNTQSIGVSASNGVVIQSVIFQNNYLAEEVNTAHIGEIKDSMNYLNEAKEDINTKISVINEGMAVLQANRKVSGDNTGLSVAELSKMLELTTGKWDSYLGEKKKLEAQLRKTDDRINRFTGQLNEEQSKNHEPSGQLLVKFYAKEAATTSVAITYVTPNAGWRAAYDIWADGGGQVKLFYKANIHQNTGVKWPNVRLSLSTGDPNETAQAPVITPWYLAFYVPQAALNEVTVRAYKRPLVDQDRPGSHILTKDDIQPMPISEVTDLVSLQPGFYQQKRGQDVNMASGRTTGALYIIDGVQVQQSSLNDNVAVDNSGVNTTFDIDIPYTIPSDGQQHLVSIKDYTLPASYRYFVVPKLDKDVFLQAQVTKWEDLNLLPGITTIYYEGTYVGQGMMDVRNLKDTMSISLGRDKKIMVKREQDTKMHTVKVIGTHEHQAFGYNITIRNTRKTPIDLVVLDGFPVSNDKDIAIEDKDAGDAEIDDKSGILTWNMKIEPNETKKIDFGFSVKYPKGRTVVGLR